MDSVLQHAGLAGILFLLYEGFSLFQQLDRTDDILIDEEFLKLNESAAVITQELQREKSNYINSNPNIVMEEKAIVSPPTPPSTFSVRDRIAQYSSLAQRKDVSSTEKLFKLDLDSIDRKNHEIDSRNSSTSNAIPCVEDESNPESTPRVTKMGMPNIAIVSDPSNQSHDVAKMYEYEEPTLDEYSDDDGLDSVNSSTLLDVESCKLLPIPLLDHELPLDSIFANSDTSFEISEKSLEHGFQLPIMRNESSYFDEFVLKNLEFEAMDIEMIDCEKPLPNVMNIMGNAPAAEQTTLVDEDSLSTATDPYGIDFGKFSLKRLPTVGRKPVPALDELRPPLQTRVSRDSAISMTAPHPNPSHRSHPKELVLDLSSQRRKEFPVDEVEDEIVTHLSLQKNFIEYIPSFAMQFLTHVRMVNLSDNYLSYLPAEIEQLVELEFLYLRSNKLEQIPQTISNLNHLKILDIGHNQLSVLGYHHLM
jgi:hypothetical protein